LALSVTTGAADGAVLAESLTALAALAALVESAAAPFALALDLRLAFWALAESAAAAESLTNLALAGKGWDIPGTWEAFSELVWEKPEVAVKTKARAKNALNMIPSRQ
jgi:hypothetical protein